MTDIIIYDDNTLLFDYAVSVLSKSYKLHCFSGSKLFTKGSGYELNLIKTFDVKEILQEDCITLLGENSLYRLEHCKSRCLIVNSLNYSQIESLKHKNNALTCGSSQSDSVSYTGISDEQILVSLNRSITALSGRVIHPFELPVAYSGNLSLYSVLSVTALRIMLDDFNSELGKLC